MADIDVAKLVLGMKDLETRYVATLEPEAKAKYMESRAFDAEGELAKIIVSQEKDKILKEFPLVDADDLADAITVDAARKLAVRVQAKAEKVQKASTSTVEQAVQSALKLKDTEMDNIKKAYGRPVQPQDETQNQLINAEQTKELGKQLQPGAFDIEKVRGTMKGVEDAAKHYGSQALEIMLGSRTE